MRIVQYKIPNNENILNNIALISEKISTTTKILIVCENNLIMKDLDKYIWIFSQTHFIPHCLKGDYYESDVNIVLSLEIEYEYQTIIFYSENQEFFIKLLQNLENKKNKIENIIFFIKNYNEELKKYLNIMEKIPNIKIEKFEKINNIWKKE